MKDTPDIKKIRQAAETYFRNQDCFCSEAIVQTLNDEFDLGYPDSVVAIASGFPMGIGVGGCTCGAISGGVMVIGIIFGRTLPGDPKVKRCMDLSHELLELFEERHKIACCRILTNDIEIGSPAHMEQCIAFTGEIAEETAKIIVREMNISW